ncbi:hypothetical protein EEL32_06205 [Brevibacillus laterosporus]|nr:hypothetical protein [Brevibacillus laterosporus]TPG70796.1 hypothetical protein EEL31_21685 [Brevibacillus laterosporus]TPG89696.1 hypothetical protein EEL32_06205 [Brevibacillus laterosporus]
METEDRTHVAIVFERVNRAGEPLDTFQLLSAWSWSTEFDLQEEFTDLAEELEPFGFGDISLDKDLQLKCCSGVILGEAPPQAIMSLKGADVRSNFEKIKNGIKGSIDFLQREFKFFSLRTVPYPAMIVSLTRFFASEKINGISYTSKQRDTLKKWFWKNCFSRRYSSGITGVHKQDLLAMDKLREDENYSIADFNCEIDEGFFRNNQFFITAVNTKTYIALLASNDPRSFISGAPIDLSKVLKNCNKNEFHHVLRLDAPSFPLEQLRAQLTLAPAHCTIDNCGPICNPYNSSPCSNAQKNT